MKIKYLALVIVPALISSQSIAQFNDGSTAPQADKKVGAVPIPSADPKGNQPQVKKPPTSHRGNATQPGNQVADKAATPNSGEKNYPNPEWKPTEKSAAKPGDGKTNYPNPEWKPTDQNQKGSAQAAKANEKMGMAKDKAKNKMDQHAAEAQKALENAQQQINN